jgi:hypothetical protein
MSKEPDLFGKTFDQQLQVAGDEIAERDISPNRRIPGEVVFEPVMNGVRVTARDSEHRVLWGFIGSKDMISQIHCPGYRGRSLTLDISFFSTLSTCAVERHKACWFSAELLSFRCCHSYLATAIH